MKQLTISTRDIGKFIRFQDKVKKGKVSIKEKYEYLRSISGLKAYWMWCILKEQEVSYLYPKKYKDFIDSFYRIRYFDFSDKYLNWCLPENDREVLDKDHLEIVKIYFEETRKHRFNVLDEGFRFQYREGVGNFICLAASCFFYSYDYRKENNLSYFYKDVEWEDFYKLLEDNLGKDENYLRALFFDKFGVKYFFV